MTEPTELCGWDYTAGEGWCEDERHDHFYTAAYRSMTEPLSGEPLTDEEHDRIAAEVDEEAEQAYGDSNYSDLILSYKCARWAEARLIATIDALTAQRDKALGVVDKFRTWNKSWVTGIGDPDELLGEARDALATYDASLPSPEPTQGEQ